MKNRDVLAENLELYSKILEHVEDVISVVDLRGRYLYASPSHRRVLGYEPHELIGTGGLAMFHPDDVTGIRAKMARCLISPHIASATARVRHKAGHYVLLEGVGTCIRNGLGLPEMFLVTSRDISGRVAAEDRMRQLAMHDPLTGLPNRDLLEDRIGLALATARREGERLAVLMLDLDRFKQVNDSLGHAAGDELLRQVAQRLRELLREEDTVARIGGDEFAVLLPRLAASRDATQVARMLVASLCAPFGVEGRQVSIGVSLGIALFPTHGRDPAALLRRADAALYRAKGDGRSTYRVAGRQTDGGQELGALAAWLRGEDESGKLEILYVPVAEPGNGRVLALEAVPRWSSAGSELGGSELLSLAEELGLGDRLGERTVAQLCADLSSRKKAGLPPLVLGLTAAQLLRPRMAQDLRHTLRAAKLIPKQLYLQVEEATAMRMPEIAYRQMRALVRSGFRLGLSGAGASHLSLSVLASFPLEFLKADPALISSVPGDQAAERALRGLVALGHGLGLRVAAEGVAGREQTRFCASNGFDAVQGPAVRAGLLAGELAGFR